MKKKSLEKINNKLVNDSEFVSQTKKAIHFANLGKFLVSEKIYKELISKGKYDHLTLHRLAGISSRLGKQVEFIQYLKAAIKYKKDYALAYGDLGNHYFRNGQFKDALNYFQIAIKYKPDLFGAYINIGNIFTKFGNNQDALKNYKIALEIKNDLPLTLYHIGDILLKNGNYNEAEKYLLKALVYEKNHVGSKIELIRIYLETFNINSLGIYRNFINNFGLRNGEEIIKLMTFFYLDSSPEKQYLRAQNYYKKLFGNTQNINKMQIKNYEKKIKVGYVSANFNDHPVMKIMESIFKNHNKNRFELFAYSLVDFEDDYTKQIKKYFKSYKSIGTLSLKDALETIRSDQLNIAVDLMGHTKQNRIELFNQRVAPIQINYLGFPGTTCIPNMDFIIADKFVIPKKYKNFYSEKVIYMPNSFINSIQYEYSTSETEYKILNLPPKSCLLSAFHNALKLSEEVVNKWARILSQTKNTYLWLKKPNEIMKKNLLSYFQSQNVEINRIFFAEKVESYRNHISRYSQSDLFLDTFNYNGHSTLIECIWSELPFVTLVGQSFASRVGASILNSLGLPELIATSSDEYVEKVVFYSQNMDKLAILKNKIKKQKKDCDFFDQKLFVTNLEEKYRNLKNRF